VQLCDGSEVCRRQECVCVLHLAEPSARLEYPRGKHVVAIVKPAPGVAGVLMLTDDYATTKQVTVTPQSCLFKPM
jgi:hypothetical protein